MGALKAGFTESLPNGRYKIVIKDLRGANGLLLQPICRPYSKVLNSPFLVCLTTRP